MLKQEKIILFKILEKKSKLRSKLNYNTEVLANLRERYWIEPNIINRSYLEESIEIGERIVSSQRTKLTRLSPDRIHEKTGISLSDIKRHETEFNRHKHPL